MTRSTPRTFALTGLATLSLAALGLLGWSLLASEPAAADAPAVHPPTAAPATTTSAPLAGREAAERPAGYYAAAVGTVLSYAVDGAYAYGLGHPEAGRQVTDLAVKGELEVAVVARRAEQLVARLTFTSLELSSRAGGKDEGGLGGAARQPLLLKLDGAGRVLGYRFAPELGGEQRNFVRGLVAAYLHTVPADAQGTWQADDADAAGELQAKFTLSAGADADAVEVARSKLRYTAMAGNELHPHTFSGGSRATFSRELGWLRAVAVDERMELNMVDLGLVVDLHTRLTIDLRGVRQADVAAAVDFDAAFAPAAGHHEDLSAGADAHLRGRWSKELEGKTLAALIAELDALLQAKPVDAPALDHAWQAVSWLVKLKPEVAAELVAFVKAGAGERLADMLVSALGAAGSEPAQAALADLRHDVAATPALRTSATVALFQVAKPGARVLGDVIADLGRAGELTGDDAMAVLLLGALAPRAGDLAVDGRTATAALLALESKATAQGRLDLFANALGNAGSAAVVPQIERLTAHQDDAVRAAAYHALRRVPGSEATLARGLGDPAASVRTDAVIALGEHDSPAAAAALVRAARDDAEPEVRRAGIQALARFAKPGTAARRTLEHLAQADPDAETRKAAAAALDGLR